MKIRVSGKKFDVGQSLSEHVETALEAAVSKYFDNAIDADVVFWRESHLISVDIVVNEGTGHNIVIKGQGQADEAYAAFDMACMRIEKQLRRYKRRLKNHHKLSLGELSLVSSGMKYVLSGNDQEEVLEEEENPLIIAEKQSSIETLTVSDAVMHMNLANLPALMFINKKTGNVSVVYHRKDGNISWVDSAVSAGLAEVIKTAA